MTGFKEAHLRLRLEQERALDKPVRVGLWLKPWPGMIKEVR